MTIGVRLWKICENFDADVENADDCDSGHLLLLLHFMTHL